MYAFGIDLGTSNSVISVYRRGRTEAIPVDGNPIMPSVVAACEDGRILVGHQAKRRASIDPENTVTAIKRRMGDRDFRVSLAGKDYSPVDISAMILRRLAEAASAYMREKVRDVVISVPAYFTNNQKEDTRLAGEKAGLNVLRLIPEPTAAAISYGLDKGKDQTILVYDLGGGTFDVSILEVAGNNFRVKAIGGDHHLGGEDFDQRIVARLLNDLRKLRPQSRDEKDDAAAAAKVALMLKEAAERVKKELSDALEAHVDVPNVLADSSLSLTLERETFEEMIKDLVDKTVRIVHEVLRDAKMRSDDVDRVILVGGSTRVPLVHRAVTQALREPYTADNVDEVVSQGAALMAARFSALAEDLAPVEVSNITAHSLGVRAEKDRFVVLIPRGAVVPHTAQKMFTTAYDNADRTEVVVFQGEAQVCSANEQIGGFAVTGIERATAGTPRIEVTFELDADDILNIKAVDKRSGAGGSVTVEKFVPKPFEAMGPAAGAKSLESLRIGVSPVGCDDAGAVLDRLDFSRKSLSNAAFEDYDAIKDFDLLFINCLSSLRQVFGAGLGRHRERQVSDVLPKFVERGGVLYVSDYAFPHISVPFPGRIQFAERGSGRSHRCVANIVDSELQEAMHSTTVPINFNTIWVPVSSASSECSVYLTERCTGKPILLSFPYGKGHVVYTAFHSGVQQSEAEQELLRFIILKTIALSTNTPLVELAERRMAKR